MLRTKYAGRQSSLTLYKSSNTASRKLLGGSKLPSLHGIPESIPVQTDYDLESDHDSPRKPVLKLSGGFSGMAASPISDLKLPTASLLRLDTFRDLNPIVINDIPSLPLVDSPSFPAIFKRKIDACNLICPFADEEKEKTSIERKTTHLTEIHRLFIGASPQSNRLSDEQFEMIFNMCMKNIIRRLPNLGALALVNDDVAPLTEPSWPHLSIAYQILMKVLFEFPEAPFITFKTATRLLRVASSGDSRERFQISLFLSRFVEFRQEMLEQLIEKFSSMIQGYMDNLMLPFAIVTILNAFYAILKDISDVTPLFTRFFRSYVVPLLADKYFSFFEQTLINIINFFVEDDQRNSSCVVFLILKKWPYTRLSKQTTFLTILMRCLPKMPQRELQPIIPRIFALLANASDSECFKVAETAFSMWTTIGFERIINDNIKLVLKTFMPHIMNAKHNHWSPSVRNNANFAIQVIMKRDSKLVHNYTKMEEEHEHENPTLKQWVVIARSAAKIDHTVNLSKKLNEISSTYSIQFVHKKGINVVSAPTNRARSNSLRTPSQSPPIFKPFA